MTIRSTSLTHVALLAMLSVCAMQVHAADPWIEPIEDWDRETKGFQVAHERGSTPAVCATWYVPLHSDDKNGMACFGDEIPAAFEVAGIHLARDDAMEAAREASQMGRDALLARIQAAQDLAREYDETVIEPCLLHYAEGNPDWIYIEDRGVLAALARERLMTAIEATHNYHTRSQVGVHYGAMSALERRVFRATKLGECMQVVEWVIPAFRTLAAPLPWCGHHKAMRDMVTVSLDPNAYPFARERFVRAFIEGQCGEDHVEPGTRLGYVEHREVHVAGQTVTLVKVAFADDEVPVLSDVFIRSTRVETGRLRAPFWTVAEFLEAL